MDLFDVSREPDVLYDAVLHLRRAVLAVYKVGRQVRVDSRLLSRAEAVHMASKIIH